MKITSFQDISNNNISVQYSSNGDIRVYVKEDKDTMKTENEVCLHLNKYQAHILIGAIADLLENE